jgi:hypothetical protein
LNPGHGRSSHFIDRKEAGEEREWCEEWLSRGGNRREVAQWSTLVGLFTQRAPGSYQAWFIQIARRVRLTLE